MQKSNDVVVLNSLVSQLEISLGFNTNVNGSVLRQLPLTQFLVKFSSIVSLADKGRIAEYNSAVQRFNFNLSYLDYRFSFNGISCLDFTSHEDVYVLIKILMSINDEEQLKGLRGDKLKAIIGYMVKLEKENPNVHKTLSYRVIRLFLSLLVIGRCFCAFIVCSFIRNQFWIGEGLNPYSKKTKKSIKTFKETLFNKKVSHRKRVVDSVKESITNKLNLLSTGIAYGAIKVADSVKGYAEGYVERQEEDDVKKDETNESSPKENKAPKENKSSKNKKPSPKEDDNVEEPIKDDNVEDDNVEEETTKSFVDSTSMFDENDGEESHVEDEEDSFDEDDEDDESQVEEDEEEKPKAVPKPKEEEKDAQKVVPKPKKDSVPNGNEPKPKIEEKPKENVQQKVVPQKIEVQSKGNVSQPNENLQQTVQPKGNVSQPKVVPQPNDNSNPKVETQQVNSPKVEAQPKVNSPKADTPKKNTFVDSSSIFDSPSTDNQPVDNQSTDNSLFDSPSNDSPSVDNQSNVNSPKEVKSSHVLTESTTFNSFSSLTEDSSIKATGIEDDLDDFI